MQSNKSSIIPGLVLILVGVFILAHRFTWFHFRWLHIYPWLFILLSIRFFTNQPRSEKGDSVFFGTFFAIVGVFFVLRNFDLIQYYSIGVAWPIFPFAAGIGFLVLFLSRPAAWGMLFSSGLFLAFSVLAFARNIGWLYWYDISRYWPVLLIALGLTIIINNLGMRSNKSA